MFSESVLYTAAIISDVKQVGFCFCFLLFAGFEANLFISRVLLPTAGTYVVNFLSD